MQKVAVAQGLPGSITIAGITYKFTFIPGKPPSQDDPGDCDYFVIDDIEANGESIMHTQIELLESMGLWDTLEERLYAIVKEGVK